MYGLLLLKRIQGRSDITRSEPLVNMVQKVSENGFSVRLGLKEAYVKISLENFENLSSYIHLKKHAIFFFFILKKEKQEFLFTVLSAEDSHFLKPS